MRAMHVLKLPIHATPGAKRTEAAGAHGDALRVRLGAPPVDGKANAALIDWAAAAFGVPASPSAVRGASASVPPTFGLKPFRVAIICRKRTSPSSRSCLPTFFIALVTERFGSL